MSKHEYDRYWEARKMPAMRYRFHIIASWIPKNSRVLDVGCGDGALGAYLIRENGCHVTGYDVSEVALERARQQGMQIVRGSIDTGQLPFASRSFDYVVASEVIEHVVHSEEVLKEMIRIADTAVIVSVPNSAYWPYRLQMLLGRMPRQWIEFPWEHLRFWSLAEFQQMLISLGMVPTIQAAGSGRRWLRDLFPSLFAGLMCYFIPKRKSVSI